MALAPRAAANEEVQMMLPFNPFGGVMAKIYGGVAVFALAIAGVQTVRIDGLWFIKGYVERLEESRERESKLIAASETAVREQKRILDENTTAQREIERLENEKSTLRNTAIADASSRYAANNRLSKVCPNFTGQAATGPADNSAQGDDGVQAGAIVVSERDFNVSNDRTADAIRYEEWARALVAAGLAVEGD